MKASLVLFKGKVLTARDIYGYNQLPSVLKGFFERYPPRQFKEYASNVVDKFSPNENPFLPTRNPVTKIVNPPKYNMKIQSKIFKMAYRFGVEDCLPPLRNNKRFYEDKYENKPYMNGVLRPKGHKREREWPAKKARMDEAMEKRVDTIASTLGGKFKKRFAEAEKKSKRSFI